MSKKGTMYRRLVVSLLILSLLCAPFVLAGGGGGGKNRPPACVINGPGCYTLSLSRVSTDHSIPLYNFKGYLETTAWSGPSNCEGKANYPELTSSLVPNVHESAAACDCIQYTEFSDAAGCCGAGKGCETLDSTSKEMCDSGLTPPLQMSGSSGPQSASDYCSYLQPSSLPPAPTDTTLPTTDPNYQTQHNTYLQQKAAWDQQKAAHDDAQADYDSCIATASDAIGDSYNVGTNSFSGLVPTSQHHWKQPNPFIIQKMECKQNKDTLFFPTTVGGTAAQGGDWIYCQAGTPPPRTTAETGPFVYSVISEAVSAGFTGKIYCANVDLTNDNTENPKHMFIECCGDNTCKNSINIAAANGNAFTSGQSFNHTDGTSSTVYYCRSNGQFSPDLDSDQAACPRATHPLNVKNVNTRELAVKGLHWTGTKCCGEEDDDLESYADSKEGCWNGTALNLGAFADPSYKRVFLNGSDYSASPPSPTNPVNAFLGCNVRAEDTAKTTAVQPKPASAIILGVDSSGSTTATDINDCTLVGDATGFSYFCPTQAQVPQGSTRQWTELPDPIQGIAGSDLVDTLSTSPLPNPTQGCCAKSQCWNGVECVQSVTDLTTRPEPTAQKQCVMGEWTDRQPQQSPINREDSGYCALQTQCFYSSSANPKCINAGEYRNDDICQLNAQGRGEWSSRTKGLALKMMELGGSDFSLMCGKPSDILGDLSTPQRSGDQPPSAFLGDGKSNNVCVLTKPQSDQRMIGVSFVYPLGTSENLLRANTIRDLFNVQGCEPTAPVANRATLQDTYAPCQSDSRILINKKTQSVIYSNTQLSSSASDLNPLLQRVANAFTAWVGAMRSKLGNPTTAPANKPDLLTFSELSQFSNLYIVQRGGNIVVFAALEKIRSPASVATYNLAVSYPSGNQIANICDYLNAYKASRPNFPQETTFECTEGAGKYSILLQQPNSGNDFNPTELWDDLTAKLRVN